jgi:hypothetical protein
MSPGVFGAVLAGVLVLSCAVRNARVRTVFTAVVGLMLGVVIAGGGVLAEPSHHLVDWVRLGLTSALRWAGGAMPNGG